MLRSGYGGIVHGMAEEIGLDVRHGHTVDSITRDFINKATLTFAPQGPSQTPPPSQQCDMVVLSGPITNFVRGSSDGTRPPILKPASAGEERIFFQEGSHAIPHFSCRI